MARNEPFTATVPSTADQSKIDPSVPISMTWKDVIDRIGTGETDKAWIEHLHTTKSTLYIVSIGRAGSGKSSLLNGFVGQKIFKEDHTLTSQEKPIQEYKCRKGDFTVIIWDCPGLQDGTEEERRCLEELARKTNKAGGIDLVLYCISMKEVRSASLQGHFASLRSLTSSLGPEIWKNTLIVLTFANMYEAQLQSVSPNISKEDLIVQFDSRIDEWKGKLVEEMVDAGVNPDIAKMVSVQPAGYHTKPHLPGRQYWASILWAHTFAAVKSASKPVVLIFKGNDENRFRTVGGIADDSFEKELEHQPIVITPQVQQILMDAKEGNRTDKLKPIILRYFPHGLQVMIALVLIGATTTKWGICPTIFGIGMCVVAVALYELYYQRKSKKRE